MTELSDGWQLTNIFGSLEHAETFVKRLVKASAHKYRKINDKLWFCEGKHSYIEIEDT